MLAKLPIIRTINTFPKKTKIALWLLIISFGIVTLLLFLLLFGEGGGASGLEGLVRGFIFLVSLFFIFLPLLFSIRCFLMRKKWAWWLGVRSLEIALLPCLGLFLGLLPILGVLFILNPFTYLSLFLLASLILLILDKKNFEKMIIPEEEKIHYPIIKTILLILSLIIVSYLIIMILFGLRVS